MSIYQRDNTTIEMEELILENNSEIGSSSLKLDEILS